MSDWYDQDGYPTEEGLAILRDWQGTPQGLIETVHEMWWPQGFPSGNLRFDKDVAYHGKIGTWVWRIATGGWSGNEEIISALDDTFFWMRFWYSTTVGGGYMFHIPEPDFHQVGSWGSILHDTDLNADDKRPRCGDSGTGCKHPWWMHRKTSLGESYVCVVGVGGGELCACDEVPPVAQQMKPLSPR